MFLIVFGIQEGETYDWGTINGWVTVPLVIGLVRTKEEEFAHQIGKDFETDSLQMIDFLSNNDSLSHYGLDKQHLGLCYHSRYLYLFLEFHTHQDFQ